MNCVDETQFYREFAKKLARQVFVPMAAPLSRGTTFHLHIKFIDGQVQIRGVATVVQVVEKPAKGVRARFTSLATDSLQFLLGNEAVGDDDLASAPSELLRPGNTGPIPMFVPRGGSTPMEARPTPPRAASLNVLAALAAHAPKIEPEPLAAPLPIPAALPPPVPVPVAPPARKWGGAIALAALVVLGVAGLGGWWATGASARGTAIDEQLAAFDASVVDGRLAGPGGNSALDRLVAARALAPEDARVKQRSAQLAQVFSVLAQKALDRADYAEAAVHLQALLLADPSDPQAAAKLKAAEDRVKKPSKTN